MVDPVTALPSSGDLLAPSTGDGDRKEADRHVRPRRHRKWIIAAVLLAVAGALHAPLLRNLAAFLIVDDGRPLATSILMLDGDRRYDAAAQFHREGVPVILLWRFRSNRLERIGVVPFDDQLARRELVKHGVPNHTVVSLPGESQNVESLPKAIRNWLQEHPQETVNVLCDRFSGRVWKLRISRIVDAAGMRRVHFVPLPHRRYTESDWWRSKVGIAGLLNGYIRLGFYWLRLGDESDWVERSNEDFAAAALRELRQ